MAETNVISICGSLRKGSFNRILARALPALAPAGMRITEAPSFADFPIYNADLQNEKGFPAPVTALADAVRAADGVIIVTPEYNFSMPGGLKNALDWVSRIKDQPFKEKPVALQSAAPGPVGGARVQYHLRQTLVFLDAMTFTRPEIFVAHCASKLDEARGITDEATRNFVTSQLEAFAAFIARHGQKH
ncbi:MAG: NAD(P)H-dependent oxidoreductase [Xanthobacteraceae bacterium]|nr:NAD(P)H-dependent oxidoreductase [Xanthobacteraceae bacterium]PWB59862.1 MAG: hypothetical protein C3F17_15770 [Bradyrhizobiaceae bacterium]